jgi:hypothetical protein
MNADIKAKLDRIVFDAKVSERKILIVPVSTITHTAYNPAARTKEGAKLKKLTESIKKHGLAYPILITADRDLVDGNRRLTACRALGHDTIECVILGMDRDEAFTTINTTSMPIGGKGWLEIGRGGGFLPEKEAKQYNELSALVGRYGIDLLIKQSLGLNVLSLCKSVVELGIRSSLEELILLTATHRLTNKINAELRADKPKEEKARAINRLIRSVK